MSIDYCHKHHRYVDLDFKEGCPQCIEEEIEREERIKEDIHEELHNTYLERQHHNLMIEEQYYNIKNGRDTKQDK